MYRGTILRLGSQICTMYHVIEAIVTRHLKECVSSISRHGRTKGGGGEEVTAPSSSFYFVNSLLLYYYF